MERGYTYTLNIKGHLMDLGVPKVMGILNVTPDSFFAESRTYQEESIRLRVRQMIEEGVDIIDIGGFSTRPTHNEVSEEEELGRVELGCKIVREIAPEIPLSIDTFRSSVAKEAINRWEVDIINDVTGGNDPDMFKLIAQQKVIYVLTHNRIENRGYRDVTAEVITELSKKINELHRLGVTDVIVDPGFGFAKTLEENFRLFDSIDEIAKMDLPVLIGISRKSMIYKTLECSPADSLAGTIALDAMALEKGANILRVHDVKPAVETIMLYKKLKESSL
ncbi:MAG: dihydropteroate synthase [Muribaculaceae bacterium]|nr:dihydropteroate synthase [Muribaculaceae bacterium]